MTITEALKLIAGRSGFVQHEALKTLRATGAALQLRYNLVAEHALDDPAAEFTPEERDALISLIVWPDDSGRTTVLPTVRVTESERARAQARADAEADGNLSVLIRRLLFD